MFEHLENLQKLDKINEELDDLLKKTEKTPHDLYEQEKKDLIVLRKKQFFSNLSLIAHSINKKKDINEFLENNKDYLQEYLLSDINKDSRGYIFFIVKIIGLIFVSLNLIGIYQLKGVNETIKDEVIFSIKRFINLTLKGTNDFNSSDSFQDFNGSDSFQEQNFSELYENKTFNQLPDCSLFFISSLFSNFLLKSLGYTFMTIFILIINSLIFNFGMNNFHFLKKIDLKSNYSLKYFLILTFYFVLFNISLGLVALVPHKLFSDGYVFYEKWLQLKKERNKNLKILNLEEEDNNDNNKNNILNIEEDSNNKNNILNEDNSLTLKAKKRDNLNVSNQTSFNIIDIKDDEIIEPKNKIINLGKNNGYFFSYFFSFLFSMICKIIFNKFLLFEEKSKDTFFFKLFLLYIIPVLSSLIFFFIFSSTFQKKSKQKKNKIISIMKFCGYLIYIENKSQEKKICCEGCRVGLRAIAYSVFGCKCCDCQICCKCCPLSQCCKVKEDLSEFNNRNETICICYKISGICSWFCNILFYGNGAIFFFGLSIILFEVLNMGFKPYLFELIESYNENNKKNLIFYIHLIYLSGIMFLYFVNMLIGYLTSKILSLQKSKSEGILLGYGLLLFLIIGTIISSIISFLIYYRKISEDYSCYLIAFSISCDEYYKLIIISSLNLLSDHIELLSYSSIISLFLLLYKIIVLIVEVFNPNIMNLIFFQFIFGIIFSVFGCCFIAVVLFTVVYLKLKNNNEDIEKIFDKKKQTDINKIKEMKERNENLIKQEEENLLLDIIKYNREYKNKEEDEN